MDMSQSSLSDIFHGEAHVFVSHFLLPLRALASELVKWPTSFSGGFQYLYEFQTNYWCSFFRFALNKKQAVSYFLPPR